MLSTGAATDLGSPQLQLFFAATQLHINLLCWEDTTAIEDAIARATQLWDALPADQVPVTDQGSFLNASFLVSGCLK
jgi:MAternally affected uncoordination